MSSATALSRRSRRRHRRHGPPQRLPKRPASPDENGAQSDAPRHEPPPVPRVGHSDRVRERVEVRELLAEVDRSEGERREERGGHERRIVRGEEGRRWEGGLETVEVGC
jgi:hypothetical protein